MMLLCLMLIGAEQVEGSAETIRELKTQERTLLDSIDELVDQKRKLDRRLRVAQAEVDALAIMVATERKRLADDARAQDLAAREARQRARSLRRLMRGQGARFVLGADGFAEGLRRTQLLQRVLHRDWVVLQRALVVVDDQRERVAALKHNQDYANEVSESLAGLKLEALDKTRDLEKTLSEVREQRSREERAFYDLRELEAILKREEEEERVAASDPFTEKRGTLPWPVAGRVTQTFGVYPEPKFGFAVGRAGVRIGCSAGTTVRAVGAGTVRAVDAVPGHGRVVVVQHSANFYGVYGGLGDVRVGQGHGVDAGAVLGLVSGDEVQKGGAYFEVRRRTVAEDTLEWLAP